MNLLIAGLILFTSACPVIAYQTEKELQEGIQQQSQTNEITQAIRESNKTVQLTPDRFPYGEQLYNDNGLLYVIRRRGLLSIKHRYYLYAHGLPTENYANVIKQLGLEKYLPTNLAISPDGSPFVDRDTFETLLRIEAVLKK